MKESQIRDVIRKYLETSCDLVVKLDVDDGRLEATVTLTDKRTQAVLLTGYDAVRVLDKTL